MTQEQLVKMDYEAQSATIEAERANIRTQIALLETQLKQNAVKHERLELEWSNYQNQKTQQGPSASTQSNGRVEELEVEEVPAPKTRKGK